MSLAEVPAPRQDSENGQYRHGERRRAVNRAARGRSSALVHRQVTVGVASALASSRQPRPARRQLTGLLTFER